MRAGRGGRDQSPREQTQGPRGTALGWARTRRRDQEGSLFARQFAACSGARLFAERGLQVAEHEAALGPVDGGPTHANADRDLIVAGPCVGGQQNLRSLELAHRVLASAQKRPEFVALGLAELDPIAYIHPCLLLVRGTDEQLNRMA